MSEFEYEEPVAEIILYDAKDVIIVSGGGIELPDDLW